MLQSQPYSHESTHPGESADEELEGCVAWHLWQITTGEWKKAGVKQQVGIG